MIDNNNENKTDKLKNAEYDGIQEYDNDLPRWWTIMFIGSLIFGLAYWIYYRNMDGPDQIDRYQKNLSAHQQKYQQDADEDISNESLLALSSSMADLEAGKTAYTANCVACHGVDMGGSIGPNLTDAYWIHGSQPLDIHRTIKEGVVEKGMLAWQGILTSKQMQQITAYVITFNNKNVDGGKEPQGELQE